MTFHTGRMYIEHPSLDGNTAFEALLGQIRASIETAVRDVMTAKLPTLDRRRSHRG